MRFFHREKLNIPNREKFEAALVLYRKISGRIPVSIGTIQAIVEKTVGWEIVVRTIEMKGTAVVMAGRGKFTVLNNIAVSKRQRRSNLAHELGHILHSFEYKSSLLAENMKWKMTEEERKQEERICDEIGANLLCPEWALRPLIERALVEIPDITGQRLVNRLSRQFQFPAGELEAHLSRCHEGLTPNQIVEEAKGRKKLMVHQTTFPF